MAKRELSKYYAPAVWTLAIINLVMGWSFSSTIPWDKWVLLLTFFSLTVFLQIISTRLGEGMSFTLATTTIFPMIYVLGITPAMIMAGIIGLIDGIFNKKDWMRTLFNASQVSFCALMGSIVFDLLGGRDVPIMFRGFIAISLGIGVQMIVNIALVTLLSGIVSGTSWRKQINQLGISGFLNVLERALTALVFTLFVSSFELWGVLAFGLLLIHLSDLLDASAKISNERMIRFELEEALLIDELTTAHNFRFLNNWLNEAGGEKMAVLFIDIDNFGDYNELYGHQEGDQILFRVTKFIKKSIRVQDKVIRYGGDEFIVLLPKLGTKRALHIGERILRNLEDFMLAQAKQPLTISIGIAVAKKADVEKQRLINAADEAMYKAKKSGKNTIRLKEIYT